MLLPEIMVSLEIKEPFLPPGFILCQTIQFLSSGTHHICCHGRLEESLVIRLTNACQNAIHFQGLMGIKEALGRIEDAGDSKR